MQVDGTVRGLADATARARALEADGYDGMWAGEVDQDPFLPLVLGAEATTRIRLGTSVAVALARSPMTLAYTADDLQRHSGGRFVLGLGSQVRAHVVRRFGMPWGRPAAQMREYVLALRAIWASWQGGDRLDFAGEYYRHSLMPPDFVPPAHEHGPPRVLLAGVGERMTRVAGEVADGFLAHTIATRAYLEDVAIPLLARGRERAGATMDGFGVHVTPIVVTGSTEERFDAAKQYAREQIAKYAAIPSYELVLDGEGLSGLREELQALAAQGRWDEMPALVDDDVLAAFAVMGEPDRIGALVHERFGHIATSIALYQYAGGSPRDLVPIYDGFRRAAAGRTAAA